MKNFEIRFEGEDDLALEKWDLEVFLGGYSHCQYIRKALKISKPRLMYTEGESSNVFDVP